MDGGDDGESPWILPWGGITTSERVKARLRALTESQSGVSSDGEGASPPDWAGEAEGMEHVCMKLRPLTVYPGAHVYAFCPECKAIWDSPALREEI